MIHKVLVLVLVAIMIVPLRVQAAESNLVISQVQISGPAGASDEFIEIYNPTTEPINLSGWSVQYKTASGNYPVGAKKNLPEFVLEPGRYYLLAHVDFSGTATPDLVYSSFSMSGSATGATVFLAKTTAAISGIEDLNIIDRLAYGNGEGNSPENASAPLPESGKALFRSADSNNNLLDFEIQDASPRNSSHVVANEEGNNEEQEQEEEDNGDAEEEDQEVPHPTGIIISEIMANPEGSDNGEEWIELFNSSSAQINLKDWLLDDSSVNGSLGSSAYKLLSTIIQPNSYLSIAIPEGKFSLNNSSADSVRLFWPDQVLAGELPYQGPVKEEQTWCRIGTSYQWCTPTPNLANAKLPDPVVSTTTTNNANNNSNTAASTSAAATQQQTQVKDYDLDVIQIIEIMPDPEGSDAGQEYVKLFNAGAQSVELKDWVIDDGAEKDAIGSSALILTEGEIEPGDELELIIPKGRFTMNNSGIDTVRVFAPDKKLKDYVSYEKAKEGIAYAKSDDVWAWRDSLDMDGEIAGAALPRSGMPLKMLSFALLPAIWYISGAFRYKKGTHEQARSHRRAGYQAGQQPG